MNHYFFFFWGGQKRLANIFILPTWKKIKKKKIHFSRKLKVTQITRN